jgi:hypothetical protein
MYTVYTCKCMVLANPTYLHITPSEVHLPAQFVCLNILESDIWGGGGMHSLQLSKEQPTYASGNHRAIIGKLGTHDIIPDVPIGARVGLFWKASHAI